ncbi:MAG: thioredoxin-dependent thiol peroxidase [Chitinophagales bacterium]|nr:thioredoxin-dependent thiol peroxidase [Chitinophagales bacterium]
MTQLKAGDKAPDFTALNQNGSEIKLSDYKGKKLILYFYPKDDTPTCTTEACNFRDNYTSLKKAGYEVVGVSINDEKAHQKFIDKYELPFNLIADPDKEVIEQYGVWGMKKFMGREFMGTHRITFVIDEDGTIEDIIKKVKSKVATQQILNSVKT